MFLGKEDLLYAPSLLDSAITAQKLAFLRGIKGFIPLPVDNLLSGNKSQVDSSLQFYLRGISASFLPGLVEQYLKPEAESDPGRFCTSGPLQPGTNNLHFRDESYTYLDGSFGFALGYRTKNRLTWLAATSFSSYYEPKIMDEIDGKPVSLVNLDKPEGPFIKQLQSYYYYRDDYSLDPDKNPKSLQSEIFKGIHWEKLLVALVSHWADVLGFGAVYIQQARKNHYYTEVDDRYKRFIMRYDYTAKRLGFKINKYGDYELSLSTA